MSTPTGGPTTMRPRLFGLLLFLLGLFAPTGGSPAGVKAAVEGLNLLTRTRRPHP